MADRIPHRFPPSGSAHGCCGACLACPTCEPEVAAESCSGDPEWMRLRARQAAPAPSPQTHEQEQP